MPCSRRQAQTMPGAPSEPCKPFLLAYSLQIVDVETGGVTRTLPGVRHCSRRRMGHDAPAAPLLHIRLGAAVAQCAAWLAARPPTSTWVGALQDSEPITALAVSPDCKTLVAASRSLACRQWDFTTGDCLRTWRVGSSDG